MTPAPDILPYMGELFLLAVFLVAAVSGGLALWLQDNRIKDLEDQRKTDAIAKEALEKRIEFLEMLELTRWAVQRRLAETAKRQMNCIGGAGTEGRRER